MQTILQKDISSYTHLTLSDILTIERNTHGKSRVNIMPKYGHSRMTKFVSPTEIIRLHFNSLILTLLV